jgi:hypothetical protein
MLDDGTKLLKCGDTKWLSLSSSSNHPFYRIFFIFVHLHKHFSGKTIWSYRCFLLLQARSSRNLQNSLLAVVHLQSHSLWQMLCSQVSCEIEATILRVVRFCSLSHFCLSCPLGKPFATWHPAASCLLPAARRGRWSRISSLFFRWQLLPLPCSLPILVLPQGPALRCLPCLSSLLRSFFSDSYSLSLLAALVLRFYFRSFR